ncbi:MAG: DUF4912 domain-containing protein [Cyanobacteria bacterium J069]|nr:MAG: DUF4912 domain-containing protein [Cyanobacteria bacterium J069]
MAQERPPLEEMTLRQLRRVASEFNVSRYSRMRKEQLVAAILAAQRSAGYTPSLGRGVEAQAEVEATKFDVGQSSSHSSSFESRTPISLTEVDAPLSDLPDGYGESRIVLMPRDPQWVYAYWDIPNSQKEEMRRQGGARLALRFYDVTDVNLGAQRPHSLQQYECDELAREWYLPVPVSDRDYLIEIGYVCTDGRWLLLAQSAPVRVPPVYPSDWVDDQFITVAWEETLAGKQFLELVPPARRGAAADSIYDKLFGEAMVGGQRVDASLFGAVPNVAGSLFGSVHMAEKAVSSYVFPSGAGLWAVPTMSGLTASGVGMGYMASGSGIGYMASGAGLAYTASGSGIGSSASVPPIRPRKFWLIADAELIVYGATEPDATVTIGGQPIKLNPDGTFRFQMSFQDGLIDYPIMAVAADGEQTRNIHLKFTRETFDRNTNTKEEAVEEWLSY